MFRKAGSVQTVKDGSITPDFALINRNNFAIYKCVNDVTYSQSYVTVSGIKKHTFVYIIIYSQTLKLKPVKNTILILAVTVFIAGEMFSGCHSSAEKAGNAREKVQDAKDKVVEANQELYQALKDSIQQFKNESEEKIIAYEKSIAEFKARIAEEKEENKAKYEKKLAELEQKNSDLKKKLEDFVEEGEDQWKSFKSEFNHDMEELGKALKSFTVENK